MNWIMAYLVVVILFMVYTVKAVKKPPWKSIVVVSCLWPFVAGLCFLALVTAILTDAYLYMKGE